MTPVSSSTYYCCTVQSGDAALINQKLPRVASRGREVEKSRQTPFRGEAAWIYILYFAQAPDGDADAQASEENAHVYPHIVSVGGHSPFFSAEPRAAAMVLMLLLCSSAVLSNQVRQTTIIIRYARAHFPPTQKNGKGR